MEKIIRNRSRYLGATLEDLDFAKKIDSENLRSCWKRCDYSREREALYWIEECFSKAARTGSCLIVNSLLSKLKVKDKANESNGCGVEYVSSSSNRW